MPDPDGGVEIGEVRELESLDELPQNFRILLPGGAFPTSPCELRGDALLLDEFLRHETDSGLSDIFTSPDHDKKRIDFWTKLSSDISGPCGDVIMIAARDIDLSISVGIGMNNDPDDYHHDDLRALFDGIVARRGMPFDGMIACSAGTAWAEYLVRCAKNFMLDKKLLKECEIDRQLAGMKAIYLNPITVRAHWKIGDTCHTFPSDEFNNYYHPSLMNVELFLDRRDKHAQWYRQQYEECHGGIWFRDAAACSKLLHLPPVTEARDTDYSRPDPQYHYPGVFRKLLRAKWQNDVASRYDPPSRAVESG